MQPTRGYLPLAPDLVVEVMSPSDSLAEIEAKAAAWLAAGTQVVLVADPAQAVLRSYERSATRTYGKGGNFDAGDVCSDWRLSVNDAFDIHV